MNNHNYPKVHYPELYILEGGYCGYYKVSGHRCEPRGYVEMDDPNHANSRREDMDQFRKAKFGRHKSYAFGEGVLKPPQSIAATLAQQQVQGAKTRNSSSAAGLFAGAKSRRTASVSLMTLAEDAAVGGEDAGDDTDVDLGDSPCPSAAKVMALKSKKGRHLTRSETYNPIRMPNF